MATNLFSELPEDPTLEPIGSSISNLSIIGGIVALLLVMFILFWIFLFQKKKIIEQSDQPPPLIDPFEEALEKLDELAAIIPRPKPKPFVFRLSEILRLYVEKKFKVPALERTGEEFIQEISVHPILRKKFHVPLVQFVQRGDKIKYSPEGPNSKELNDLLLSAREFVYEAQKEWESHVLNEQKGLIPENFQTEDK